MRKSSERVTVWGVYVNLGVKKLIASRKKDF